MRHFFLTKNQRIKWHCANPVDLASLRCPVKSILPGARPQLAFLFEVVALLKLLLSGVAAEKRLAELIDVTAKVLTGHANASSLPALKASVVNKAPFLHTPGLQYIWTRSSTMLQASLQLMRAVSNMLLLCSLL